MTFGRTNDIIITNMAGSKINPIVKLSIENSILFVLYSNNSKKQTFENLVKKCFGYFPEIFSLKNNPKWPDTRKLDRPLRDLRERKLIKGGSNTFISLTDKGKKIGQETNNLFCQKKLL